MFSLKVFKCLGLIHGNLVKLGWHLSFFPAVKYLVGNRGKQERQLPVDEKNSSRKSDCGLMLKEEIVERRKCTSR